VNPFSLTYDAENRLTQAVEGPPANVTVNYAYDADGRRVQKTGSAAVTYVYDGFGNLAAEYGTGNPEDGTQYLTADHLGSTRLVTNAAGGVVHRYDYLPFGEGIAAGVNGRSSLYSTSTFDGLTVKFTGKERDAETGLDYFGARYFSGAQGRFTTPDWSAKPEPIPYADLRDPQSLNLYAYVRNNPLSRTDPTGHYLDKCASGDKQCEKGIDRFEAQRQKDLGSKNIKVRNAAAAWGNRGDDNHINVVFKTQKQVDADAHTAPGYTTDAMVTPGAVNHSPLINAEFSESLKGSGLARTIAHEGSHVEDDMNFLKSYNPVTGLYMGALNFSHFDTEFQAFGAGSGVTPYPMFPAGPSGYSQLEDYIRRAYSNADQLVFDPTRFPQQ
jgi:RHS repeat-associated protein